MKIVSLLLVCLMINVAGVSLAFASDSKDKKIAKRERKIRKRAAKIKKGVRKLGVGKDSVVKVKLRNKTKIKGYISQIADNSFTVTDKNGKATVIEYNKAKQVRGNNLSKGAWIAIGVGIGAAAVIIILYIFIATHQD